MAQTGTLPETLKQAASHPSSGLFKDTTLVLIIGMFDLLGMGKAALTNLNWAGLHREMYLFVAVVFFFCCYGMSLYSGYLERKLDTENKFQKK